MQYQHVSHLAGSIEIYASLLASFNMLNHHVVGFLYSLRCKDDCYEIGLAGRGVGKQLGPDTDVTHTHKLPADTEKVVGYSPL